MKRDKLLTAVVAGRADGELLKLVSPDVPTEKQNGAKWKPDASACGPESTLSSRATQRKPSIGVDEPAGWSSCLISARLGLADRARTRPMFRILSR